MSRLRTLLAFALCAAVLTIFTSAASAAETRVVSPSSTRTQVPCTVATPCRLDFAMSVSFSGDDVSLLPGDYYQSGTTPWAILPMLPPQTSIHGTFGQPLPVIHGRVVAASSFMKLDGASARDLAVVIETVGEFKTVKGLHLVKNATAERVQVRGTNKGTDTVLSPCRIEDGTMLDSLCTGAGTTGQVPALSVGDFTTADGATAKVRNVTAVSTAATGPGLNVATYTGLSLLTATNLIARGRTEDVVLYSPYTGKARLEIDHSNYRADIGKGPGAREIQVGLGNQTGSLAATPLFVDEAAGDYRQAPGSPTIDAGVNPTLPLFDFGGDPRLIGARVDIGADEFFPPPVATTGAASRVGDRTATLNGTVNPMGDAATVMFQYGTTTAYGSTASAPNLPATANASPVAATIAGLRPDTTYNYRVVATTARGGRTVGANRTFRTDPSDDGEGGGGGGAGGGGAGSGSGGGSGPGVRPGAAATISALRIGKRWRLGSQLPRAAKRKKTPVGTTITFTLSKKAATTFEFSQPRSGRQVGRACKSVTRANRRRPKCTIAGVRGRLTVDARAGKNSIRFQGRLSRGVTLKPGRYLLTVHAGGNASSRKRARFTIVR